MITMLFKQLAIITMGLIISSIPQTQSVVKHCSVFVKPVTPGAIEITVDVYVEPFDNNNIINTNDKPSLIVFAGSSAIHQVPRPPVLPPFPIHPTEMLVFINQTVQEVDMRLEYKRTISLRDGQAHPICNSWSPNGLVRKEIVKMQMFNPPNQTLPPRVLEGNEETSNAKFALPPPPSSLQQPFVSSENVRDSLVIYGLTNSTVFNVTVSTTQTDPDCRLTAPTNVSLLARTFQMPANLALLGTSSTWISIAVTLMNLPIDETPIRYFFGISGSEQIMLYYNLQCKPQRQPHNFQVETSFGENGDDLSTDKIANNRVLLINVNSSSVYNWTALPNHKYAIEFVAVYVDYGYVVDHWLIDTPIDFPGEPFNVGIDDVDRNNSRLIWGAPSYTGGSSTTLNYVINYIKNPGNIVGKIETNKTHWQIPSELTCDECSLTLTLAAKNDRGESKLIEKILPPNTKFSKTISKDIIGVISGSIVFVALLLFIFGTIYVYKRRHKKSSEIKPICLPKELDSIKRFRRSEMITRSQIGKGNYGIVLEGFVNNDDIRIRAAFKKARSGAGPEVQNNIVTEAMSMRNAIHPNIVLMYGLCLEKNEVWLILELMQGGNLLEALRAARPLQNLPSSVGILDLINLISGLLNGCSFVDKLGYVHRDLAARNCLLTSNDLTNCILKLSDFGLTRSVYVKNYYRLTSTSNFAFRWTAPEILAAYMQSSTAEYTAKCDVWSFGVTCWEIVTLGKTPYENYITEHDVISAIINKTLLPKPRQCPSDVFSFISLCFHTEMNLRKSFTELSAHFDLIANKYFKNSKNCDNICYDGEHLESAALSDERQYFETDQSCSSRGPLMTPQSAAAEILSNQDLEMKIIDKFPPERNNSADCTNSSPKGKSEMKTDKVSGLNHPKDNVDSDNQLLGCRNNRGYKVLIENDFTLT